MPRSCSRIAAVLVLVACTLQACAGDVILKPVGTAGRCAAVLVLVQEDGVPAEAYVPLLSTVQDAYLSPLWVGIPEYNNSQPTPSTLGSGIDRVLSTFSRMGINLNETYLFYAAHGPSGFMLQQWINASAAAARPTGQILLGSFLQRSFFNVTQSNTFPTPTLTIGGELDGVCRVTRIAESLIHQPSETARTFPVVINRGQSHWQFASGVPTPMVKLYDLVPEVSDADAYSNTAASVCAFMLLSAGDDAQWPVLSDKVEATRTFAQPIVDAFYLEGSYHIKPPCYSNPPSSKCQVGSPWIVQAQEWMGGSKAADITWECTNQFHPVWKIPFHLPHVFNNCTSPTSACTLNLTTVAQNIYNSKDSLDTGLVPVSASEVRSKMNSRQAVEIAIGFPNAEFNVTDAPNLCAMINTKTFDFAMSKAGAETLARYKAKGEAVVMGPDIPTFGDIGPLWIWNPLHYTQEPAGVVNITSPMLKTPVKFFLKIAAGYHYCKVLSPARALEWIYVDGLRLHDSLSNTTHFPPSA